MRETRNDVFGSNKEEVKDNGISRKRFLRYATVLGLGASGVAPSCMRFATTGNGQEGTMLNRRNLMIYRDEKGKVHPVQTVNDWLQRKERILSAMQTVMGQFPGKEQTVVLDPSINWEIDEGSYIIRYISYSSDAGERVPAYLLIPKEALNTGTRFPALLSPLGTGQSRITFGKDALEKKKFPVWDDYRDWPRELVQQGYVTLVPSYPLLGEYNPNLDEFGYQSGTMKAVWNNVCALNLLDQLPYVRSGVYGSIGHSLGGHNSIFTAVFDERIKVVVSSCGLDSFVDYMDGDISGWSQKLYMPKIENYSLEEIPFDFHEMIAALAPRICFVNAPLRDSNFKWRSAATIVESAMQIYELYNVPERLQIEHPNADHVFPKKERMQSYQLFDQYLV